MSDADRAGLQGTFTILFTDMEGSTDLRVRAGDVVANEIIRVHDDLVRSHLEAAGAVESKSLGDGFMALFTSAGQAIEAAVAIQRAIEEHNRTAPNEQLSVRMGLNSGDVTQLPGDVHGTAVHAASRIAGKAQGGQILASQVVQSLAGTSGGTRITDRGLFWLKGFPERWRLFEVLWRDREHQGHSSRDTKAASAAAFDLESPRAIGPVVGRTRELQVIAEQLAQTPGNGLRATVLEGEAGIGKTRMLDATADMAATLDEPFWVLDATADEELRGPFLLFRSLLASPRMTSIAQQAMALEQLDRAREALTGRSPQIEGLSAQEQMLRTFDEVANAFLALTRERPLALMLDDLQWADEDSIQLVRYLVRTIASGPIFLLISLRPYSDSSSGAASKLIADLDRMRVTHVLRLHRLSRLETGELLESLLGAPIDESTLQSIHTRSEGVPFFIEELTRAYREAEALQLIDGTWTMTRLSGAAVPSSIQSLVERRLAQLSDECRSRLADAGVLGRRFRLSDLSRVLAHLEGGDAVPEWRLGEELQNAIDLGLIVEESGDSRYDYAFSHDQIRASLLGSSSRHRIRAIHGAMAETLAEEGGTENLSMLTYHALQAGDQALAVASALDAARAAISVSAPEEAVRLIDATLLAASEPERRIEMLRVKDDALAVLDRGADRLASLAEMAALTAAVSSPALDAEVKLRRASAARANQDFDLAAELAATVRKAAVTAGDRELELAACLELGQALTTCPIGEGYIPLAEVDLDAAEEAFGCALAIARDLESRSDEADALRELAMVEYGRVKKAAIAMEAETGSRLTVLAAGPELFAKSKDLAEQAFRIYEDIGDKRGGMSALISMAYAHVTDPTAQGMAGRIEHIRALHHNRAGEVTESQRAIDDALMLFSIHAYARLNLQPELAMERGRQAFEAARVLGDRWLECLAAGGMAMSHLMIGDTDESGAWIDRAANAAMNVPSTAMAWRLEMWRGAHAAAGDDADAMVRHFERAAELAGQKSVGGRCEALARLAMECARIGATTGDRRILDKATEAATETIKTSRRLGGHVPWEPAAHAALALVCQATGDDATAADESRAALEIDGETHLTLYVFVLWAAARTLIRTGQPEAPALAAEILAGLSYLAMSIADPQIRARWLDVPIHREVAEIVGFDPAHLAEMGGPGEVILDDDDLELLRTLAAGSPVAAAVSEGGAGHSDEVSVLLDKMGVATRNEAIEFAIKAGVTWQ